MRRAEVRAVGVAAWLAVGGLLWLGASAGRSRSLSPGPQPDRFVATFDTEGVGQSMAIYSATSGVRVRSLGTFGSRLTGEGLAVTAGDTAVYYVAEPRKPQSSLSLMRLSVATGHRRQIAEGQQPAIDDASDHLAFMTGLADVEVRDLHTGARRTIDLRAMLGDRLDPLNSKLAWLGDDRTLAMLPADRAIPASGGDGTSDRSAARCRSTQTTWRLVFIHVPRTGRLTAHCRTVSAAASKVFPLSGGGSVLTASPTDPTAVWILDSVGSLSAIEQIAPHGPPRLIADLGHDLLPEAIDRTGHHLLYVKGRPPAVWEATLLGDHLVDRHELIARANLDEVAW